MQLIINGEQKESSAKTVLDLIQELQLNPQKIVTELNTQIIAREDYEKTGLHPNDVLEFVQFVGGG